MRKRTSTSIDLSGTDRKKIEFLVKSQVYTHFSDGIRDIIRRGTREVTDENGLSEQWKNENNNVVEDD